MTKTETFLTIGVAVLVPSSGFFFGKVIAQGEEIAALKSQTLDLRAQTGETTKLAEQIRLLTAEVAGLRTQLARVETKLETR